MGNDPHDLKEYRRLSSTLDTYKLANKQHDLH